MASKIRHCLEAIFSPTVFAWFFPILLILPNIGLDITEYSHFIVKATNILLPFGIYVLLIGLWRNIGRTALLLLPILILSGFQIVLLMLYGESIIAVDMFLNLVTTNVDEAAELLGNLAYAIATVCAVYLPTIIWATVLAIKKKHLNDKQRFILKRTGLWASGAGFVLLVACYFFAPHFKATREIFPINVMRNLVTAARRTMATEKYYNMSSGFKYDAVSTRNISQKEVIVLILGETSRTDNWQIFGYNRPTNPLLSKRTDLLKFPKTLTESNTTYKSVPMLLSFLTTENYGDSIYYTKSVISAFNEAGYRTAFFSNQGRNRSFIDYFAREAQKNIFLRDDNLSHSDFELIPEMKKFISESPSGKIFIVLHTYGSHFNYIDRYKDMKPVFTPDHCAAANSTARGELINAYDNTIVLTDKFINSTIDILDSLDVSASLVYVSDHGEDIFDDTRERFLHSSPVPTYYQLHVPMIMWMSEEFKNLEPALYANAKKHQNYDISSSGALFDTLLQLGGVHTRHSNRCRAITDDHFRNFNRLFLNDYNEGVNLSAAGFRKFDFDNMRRRSISFD